MNSIVNTYARMDANNAPTVENADENPVVTPDNDENDNDNTHDNENPAATPDNDENGNANTNDNENPAATPDNDESDNDNSDDDEIPAATPGDDDSDGTNELPAETEAPTALPKSEISIAKTETPGGFPSVNTLLPYIGASAVVIIIALIFLSSRHRKKKRARAPVNPVVFPTNKDTPNPYAVERSGLIIGNVHHIGQRESQQDSFGVSDISNQTLCAQQGIMAVVADGMGGLTGGAEISAMVTSYMLRTFTAGTRNPAPSDWLLQMVLGANQEVRRYLSSVNNQVSGSTVVAALIKDKCLYFVSVGDSRIALLRGGVLTQLNREHTYATQLDEKAARNEISFAEAKQDAQRGALTSYIGIAELSQVDRNARPIPLVSGDRILLMTDGIFNALTDEELSLAAGLSDIYEASQHLQNAVLAKQHAYQDNFTAVILQVP